MIATLCFLCFCFVLFTGCWLALWLAQEEPEIVILTTVVLFIFITFAFYTTGGNAA